MNHNKRTSAILVCLFLLPWGMQCLIADILPIYIKSLPFATESTVGLVTGIGAVVTVIGQLVWAVFADRAARKSRVLCLSLLIVAAVSVAFLAVPVNNLAVLLVLTVLFYSSYMTHQPLIDTLGAEQCIQTKHTFSWFRSYASLGYGCMELLYILLLMINDSTHLIFLYIAILALVSAVISLMMRDSKPAVATEETADSTEKFTLSVPLVKFLTFTFFLFVCGSMLTTFFPVYFTDKNGLQGDPKLFTLIAGVGTFLEWGLMLVCSKLFAKLKPRTAFALIALAGVARCAVLFLTPNPYIAALIVPFNALWFALMWSVSTPYLKQLVPENALVRAQSLWTVVAFGIAPFIGSYLGGLIAEYMGMKTLFMLGALLLLAMFLSVGLFFSEKRK